MTHTNKAKNLVVRLLKWCQVDTVLNGLGLGIPAEKVHTTGHPGGLWAVETGNTLLVDVSGNPHSEETLLRLCKIRRGIAIYTVLTVLLALLTISQLAAMTDLAGLCVLATLVSVVFLTSKVSAQQEAARHVLELSTDPSAVKHGLGEAGARETASASEKLAQSLRQYAANEAFIEGDRKRDLVSRASEALRANLPSVNAAAVHSVTTDITDTVVDARRPQ